MHVQVQVQRIITTYDTGYKEVDEEQQQATDKSYLPSKHQK